MKLQRHRMTTQSEDPIENIRMKKITFNVDQDQNDGTQQDAARKARQEQKSMRNRKKQKRMKQDPKRMTFQGAEGWKQKDKSHNDSNKTRKG